MEGERFRLPSLLLALFLHTATAFLRKASPCRLLCPSPGPLSLLPTDAVHPLPPPLLFSSSPPLFHLSYSRFLCPFVWFLPPTPPPVPLAGGTYAEGQSGQTLFVYNTCVHTAPCQRRVVGRADAAFSRLSVIFPPILHSFKLFESISPLCA